MRSIISDSRNEEEDGVGSEEDGWEEGSESV